MNVGSLIVVTNCYWSLLSPLTERFSRATKMSPPPPPLTFSALSSFPVATLFFVLSLSPLSPLPFPPAVAPSRSDDAVSPRLEGPPILQPRLPGSKFRRRQTFPWLYRKVVRLSVSRTFFLRHLRFIHVISQVVRAQGTSGSVLAICRIDSRD